MMGQRTGLLFSVHQYLTMQTADAQYNSGYFQFQEHHEEDFFLYIAYSDENVYGCDI